MTSIVKQTIIVSQYCEATIDIFLNVTIKFIYMLISFYALQVKLAKLSFNMYIKL